MTKLERALDAAGQLPEELQEKLGDDLLHFVDRYLTLRDDIDLGLSQLDAGEGEPADAVFSRLKARLGY